MTAENLSVEEDTELDLAIKQLESSRQERYKSKYHAYAIKINLYGVDMSLERKHLSICTTIQCICRPMCVSALLYIGRNFGRPARATWMGGHASRLYLNIPHTAAI